MTATTSQITTLAPAEVELGVSNLPRSLTFYRKVLGLTLRSQTEKSAELGTPQRALIVLHALEQPQPPRRSTGLFHLALLLPTRADLGRFIEHLAALGVRLGASDHVVSEAVYLNDPDGHGIEVYRDRPRSEWTWIGGEIEMNTLPLDIEAVVQSASGTKWTGIPADTVMGHIHLKVSDLQTATDFYRSLGFDLMFSGYPGASFLSVGGYHHHLGLNVWQSQGAPAPAENTPALRLAHFSLGANDLAALKRRLNEVGQVADEGADFLAMTDPAGNHLRFSVR
ncbi:VOC family protein [Deinococcus sp.]|uniref:VOC family protein n=1 Tax=Deinococcus sp. TaxID=47478 RepID=UPI003B5A38A7